MIKLGITGTRNGMDPHQLEKIKKILDCDQVFEIHHGDCVGVDEEVARLAKSLGHRIVSHPPIKNELRAFTPHDEIRKPLGYLARDRKIVDATEVLIVVPFEQERQLRGGTWYTHDYAIKRGKHVNVIYPKLNRKFGEW